MFKHTTAGLVLLLVTLASQGAYAAPAPFPGFGFKILGLPKYRSGSGWGDFTELPWKQAVNAEAKTSKAASSGDSSTGTTAGAAAAAALLGGGIWWRYWGNPRRDGRPGCRLSTSVLSYSAALR